MQRPRDEVLGRAFGYNLAQLRDRKGLTRERLAWAAGFSRDTIVKLESGKRMPRMDTILILCDVLRVGPEELLDGLKPTYEPKLPLP